MKKEHTEWVGMQGIIRKVEYEGDWETFVVVAKETIKIGGSLLYNVDEKRGVIVEPDGTEKLAVSLPELQVLRPDH